MHDEPTQAAAAGAPERMQAVVMALLLGSGHLWPWSARELALELGDELGAADAIAALEAAGLIHRIGSFVFPSRAAVAMAELDAV